MSKKKDIVKDLSEWMTANNESCKGSTLVDLQPDPTPVDSGTSSSLSSPITSTTQPANASPSEPTTHKEERDGTEANPAVAERPMTSKNDTFGGDARQVDEATKDATAELAPTVTATIEPAPTIEALIEPAPKPGPVVIVIDDDLRRMQESWKATVAARKATGKVAIPDPCAIPEHLASDASPPSMRKIPGISKEGLAEMAQVLAECEERRRLEKEVLDARLAEEEKRKLDEIAAEVLADPPLDEDGSPIELQIRQSAASSRRKLGPILAAQAIVGEKEGNVVEAEPVDYALEGVATDSNHVEVSGPSDAGKTTAVFAFATASASTQGPVRVFGREVKPVAEGKLVLIVEEENDRPTCILMIRASCQMLGLNYKATMARIVLLARTGFQPNTPASREVFEMAMAGHWGRIFLDSRARIFPGRSNSEEDQAWVAGWLKDLIEAAHCSVWLIGHTRKGGDGSELDEVSGSVQRVAGADVLLMMSSKQDQYGKVLWSRIVYRKIRGGVQLDEHPTGVQWATVKEDGRWRCEWSALGKEVLTAGPDSSLRDQLIQLITDEKEVARSKARTTIGMGVKPFDDLVFQLKEEKIIVPFKKEFRGREARYLRLRRPTDFDKFDELPFPKKDE